METIYAELPASGNPDSTFHFPNSRAEIIDTCSIASDFYMASGTSVQVFLLVEPFH